MKFARRVALACAAAACVALGTAALAQDGPPPGPPPPPKPITAVDLPPQMLQHALGLTQEQTDKVAAIAKAFFEARRQILPPPPQPGAPPPDPAALWQAQEKVRVLEQDANKQIYALLTPQQQAALTRIVGQHNDLQVLSIPPPVVPRLRLTPDQWQKLHAIAVKAAQAIQRALEQGRQQRIPPPQVQEQIRKIRDEAHQAALGILTDEQKAILAQFAQTNPGPPQGPDGPPPGGGGPPPGDMPPQGGPGAG